MFGWLYFIKFLSKNNTNAEKQTCLLDMKHSLQYFKQYQCNIFVCTKKSLQQ